MAVTGSYMTWHVRSALAYVKAYGECVARNVMPVFADVGKKADEVANAEFERLGAQPATDDTACDMSVLAEAANEKGQAFYETMSALRQATLNLFAAGLFHLVEQQLADLCRDGAFTVEPPSNTNLSVVADWYKKHFGLDLHSMDAWPAIEELRLVANAIKHAEGSSAKQLREIRPELFRNPILEEFSPLGIDVSEPVHSPLSGDDFFITDKVFQEYSGAAERLFAGIGQHFEANQDEYYPQGG